MRMNKTMMATAFVLAATTNASAATQCLICAAGTYSTAGSTSCTACPIGQYQDQVGQGSCKNCPAGSYAGTTARTACSTCEAGNKCVGGSYGSSGKSACASGTYSSPGKSSCSNSWTLIYQRGSGTSDNATGSVSGTLAKGFIYKVEISGGGGGTGGQARGNSNNICSKKMTGGQACIGTAIITATASADGSYTATIGAAGSRGSTPSSRCSNGSSGSNGGDSSFSGGGVSISVSGGTKGNGMPHDCSGGGGGCTAGSVNSAKPAGGSGADTEQNGWLKIWRLNG